VVVANEWNRTWLTVRIKYSLL